MKGNLLKIANIPFLTF